MKQPIYLDYNATTLVDPIVLETMIPYFSENFGNAASRTHAFGWVADEAVEVAREQIASLINADPSEIIFTSGATESVNSALKGIADAYREKGNHIITVSTEHKAVLDTCAEMESKGFEFSYLPVDNNGIIDPNLVEKAIRQDTILICMMHANNETGVLHDLKPIANLAHTKNLLFMTDAAQSFGKIPIDVIEQGVDVLALSAHKIYGPKGVGALYLRRRNPRVNMKPLMHGGGHERGLRSGTLNVPGIVGLGAAADLCQKMMQRESDRLAELRDKFEAMLLAEFPFIEINGKGANRLTHVSNIAFGNLHAAELIAGLRNVAISSGSACTSASTSPSHVLKAMGVSRSHIHSSLRFSLGRFTTAEEMAMVGEDVIRLVKGLL